MKLFIPELGTNLLLTEDWTVTIHPERRNEGFYKFTKRPCEGYFCKGAEVFTYTIPKGSVLSVERIYIRAGAKDFSSITFRYIPIKGKAGIRFWAKLEEVNNIEFELIQSEKKPKYPNGTFSIERCYRSGDVYYNLHFSEKTKESYSTISFDGFYFRPLNKVYFVKGNTKHYSSLETFKIACKKTQINEQLVESFIRQYETFITKVENK